MTTYTIEKIQEMMKDASISQMGELNACINWLKANNLESCRNIGPLQLDSFSKGEQVKIRKGAQVFSTAPSFTPEGKTLSRSQTITVHKVMKGFVDYQHSSRDPKVRNPEVHWAGAGGYWHWTDINNVEKI